MNPTDPLLQLKKETVWEKVPPPIWIASTLSLQRNIASFPFPQKMDRRSVEKVAESLGQSLLQSSLLKNPTLVESSELKQREQEFLQEYFLQGLSPPSPLSAQKMLFDQRKTLLALINSSDHLTLHSIASSDWDRSWQELFALEAALAKSHPFAYSDTFGYLTSNLEDSGTAFTIQAFLHLPALCHSNELDRACSEDCKEDIARGGLAGSHKLIGDIVVVKNRRTLGVTEEQIVETVHECATKLTAREETLRSKIKQKPPLSLCNAVSRSLGLLKHSYQIDLTEALRALSLVKLGIYLGWITGLTEQKLIKIFFEVRRGHLALSSAEELPQELLAQKRGKLLQSFLSQAVMKLR